MNPQPEFCMIVDEAIDWRLAINGKKITGEFMRTTWIFCILIMFVLFAGCSYLNGPAKELEALNAAKDEVLTQWAKIIDKEASEASIDEARKVFDSKKANIIAKRQALNSAPRGMNGDWLTKWMDAKASDEKVISAMSMKFGSYDTAQKFRKLGDEFIEAAYGK